MRDLQSLRLMWLKAILFIVIGLVSAGMILCLLPDWRVGLLLALTVWAFCRAYYFAFYVLEHYADPSFRYAGLFSLVRHLLKPKKRRAK